MQNLIKIGAREVGENKENVFYNDLMRQSQPPIETPIYIYIFHTCSFIINHIKENLLQEH